MENYIIGIVLVLILIPAIYGCVKHFKGEGSCCGGPKQKAPHKKIKGKPLKVLTVEIQGMHCENCKNRIEGRLDDLEGVVAKVNLDKKIAKVSLYRETDTELIRKTIEDLDFTVGEIKENDC